MVHSRDGCSEEEPLLGRSTSSPEGHEQRHKSRLWPTMQTISPKYRFVPVLGCLIIFINEAEYYVKQVATMRAIEAMYCYQHYLALDSPLVNMGRHIPEPLCKDHSIQKNLATTAGLIMACRQISSMIGAVPLGWVADSYGRKIVLLAHKINVTLTCAAWLILYLGFPRVPIWTLYLSGLPGLIGGNFDVGLAALFASYTDVMPSATERASIFFLTTSMQYLAQAFCPYIGAFLMNLDGKGGTSEVNLTVSLCLSILTVFVVAFLFPETLHEAKKGILASEDNEGVDTPESDQVQKPHNDARKKSTHWMQNAFSGFAHSFQDSFSSVGALNFTLLAFSITFASIGTKSIDWYGLVQYPVIKLHWTFPQASNIISIQGLLMLIHFSLLLPYLNRLAAAWLDSSVRAHFAIMAVSAALLTIGSIVIGLSNSTELFVTGVVTYLFGEGLPTATQAYIVSLVDKSKVARVMSTLSITSISGKLLASLLFPRILAFGLDSHVDILIGLPFFFCAAGFVLSAACFGVVGWRTMNTNSGHVVAADA